MTCRPCTSLQESAADYLPTSFSDMSQLSLWSGNHTPAKSYENEPQKDGSPDCTCGKETSDCSIHPTTPDAWIASMQDSLARTLASLESRQAYLREPDQVFTEKSCALLASFDRATCFWRTLQQSFLTDSEPFSQTWPRWGMTAGGYAYAHPMSGRRIIEIDGFYWQTPVADDSVNREKGKFNSRGEPKLSAQVKYWPTPRANDAEKRGNFDTSNKRNGLPAAAKMWPTPTTNDAKNSTLPESQIFRDGMAGALMRDGEKAGGQLNPDWVAWLMGFPIAWANSKATETRKSHCKPPSLGVCSVGSDAA